MTLIRPFARSLHRLSDHLCSGAAVIGMLWLVQGCTTWTPLANTSAQAIAPHAGDRVRVILATGTVIVLDHPHVVGDTLFGLNAQQDSSAAIPLSKIRSVQVDQINPGATLLALGITAVLVAVVASAGPKGPPPPPSNTSGCPLVYSWDGTRWRLDSGTFGGAIAAGLQRTDVDNLAHVTTVAGELRLRLADELPETDHVDALEVVAVDHAVGVTVAPDASGRLHTIQHDETPVSALDHAGHDELARVTAADGWNWESAHGARDTARAAEVRDGLELKFVKPAGVRHGHLVLDGSNTPWAVSMLGTFIAAHGTGTKAWFDSLDASPAFALATQTQLAREAFLDAAVWDGTRWVSQGLFWESGPEISKRQVMDLDLSGVRGDTVRVRLESVPSFWLIDRVAMDFSADQPITQHVLTLRSAVDKHGRDVRPLLASTDHTYYTLETGDAAELVYDVPPAPATGMTREFILHSTGWYHPHSNQRAAPDVALLAEVASGPLGISKAAVSRLNAALAALADR